MAYIFHYTWSSLEIMCIAFIVLLLEDSKLFYLLLLLCLCIEILALWNLFKCLIAIKCSKVEWRHSRFFFYMFAALEVILCKLSSGKYIFIAFSLCKLMLSVIYLFSYCSGNKVVIVISNTILKNHLFIGVGGCWNCLNPSNFFLLDAPSRDPVSEWEWRITF